MARQLGAEVVIGEARKIRAEIFAIAAVREIGVEQALDSVRDFAGRAAEANRTRDSLVFTNRATQAKNNRRPQNLGLA